MRNALADELTSIAAEDSRVTLLSGDIGNRMFDRFKEVAPQRFINCGIAEGNMMGVAAGLALSGLRPVVYTIAPFTTYRCYEQIRIDACYHQLPIIIVGTGAGLTYAELGPTHHSCEDIAIMRVLPGMTVLAPADGDELRRALRAALTMETPCYLRIGKKGEPLLSNSDVPFAIGRSATIREGEAVCLIGCGPILSLAMEAADQLVQHDISCRVENFHTIKPLDTERLRELFTHYKVIAVVEEHSRIGGLGAAIAEWFGAQESMMGQLLSFGTDDCFPHSMGSQSYVRASLGLTATVVSRKVVEHI